MSFQMALEDAQTELALDETFAFLDGFDLSAYDQQLDSSDAAFCGSFSGLINFNTTSSFGGDSLTSSDDADFTTDSDDSLSSLLSQFADGSGPLFDFSDDKLDVDTPSIVKQVAPQQVQQPNKPQKQQTQPPRMKKVARTSKATATAAAAAASTTSAPAATATAAGPAAKRPRKHNRIEILKLREQIEELQARHAQLQNFGGDRQQPMQTSTVAAGAISVSVSVAVAEQHALWQKKTKQRKTTTATGTATTTLATTSGNASAPRSVWLELAVEQYRQLQQSEELNRKLRDAVAKQLKVTSSFQSLLTKKVSFQDLDLLMGTSSSPTATMQREPLSPQDQRMAGLCRRMESQFEEADLISHTISVGNDVTSVFTTCQTKQDAVRGPLFELITNTPVPSGFQQLGCMMWDRIIQKKEIPVVDSQLMPQLSQNKPFLLAFHDKHVQMKLSSKFGELLVDGSVALGKIEEANRVIITVASTHSLVNSDLVFRESAWIVVSEDASASNTEVDELRLFSWGQLSSSKSLFQTFYRLHCEKHDPRSATGTSPFAADEVLDEKTAYLREFVMKALSDNMRQHMAQLQNSLLSEVGSLASNIMDVRCPMIECPC